MVNGIVELINFAFGQLFMFGAFITIMMMSDDMALFGVTVNMPGLNFSLPSSSPWRWWPSWASYRALAYRPLRDAPHLAALISAIGVSSCCRTWPSSSSAPSRSKFPDIPLFTTAAGAPKHSP